MPGLRSGLSSASILGSAECDGDTFAIQRSPESNRHQSSRLATSGSRNARTTRCTPPRIRPGSPFAQRIDFEIIVAVNRKNSISPPPDPLTTRLPPQTAPHLRRGLHQTVTKGWHNPRIPSIAVRDLQMPFARSDATVRSTMNGVCGRGGKALWRIAPSD